MTFLTIRRATVHDAGAIAAVHVATWRSAYAGIVPDDYLASLDVAQRADRMRQVLDDPQNPFTTEVAAGPDGIIGFVTYGPYREDQQPVDPDAGIGEVLAIYVDTPSQGAGAGRALMDAAVAGLRATGVRLIRLWVLEGNSPSRSFYERYGLTPDGTTHLFRINSNGVAVDLPEVRYAMAIGDGQADQQS